MKNKFMTIYNALSMMETKGGQTLLMADCLRFIEQCIKECEEQEIAQQNTANTSEEK